MTEGTKSKIKKDSQNEHQKNIKTSEPEPNFEQTINKTIKENFRSSCANRVIMHAHKLEGYGAQNVITCSLDKREFLA